MLILSNLTKKYGHLHVLQGINLNVQKGCCLCLAGANSCGKTTLLSIISGISTPDSGSFTCNGTLSYIPQNDALLEDLTVADNLKLWYSAFDKNSKDIFATHSVEQDLGLFPHRKKMVSKLSGGMKKRLSIAVALLSNPDCLVMDEPFTALDLIAKQEIIGIIKNLKTQGKTVIFSSHDPLEISSICDVLAVMDGGVINETVDLTKSTFTSTEISDIIFAHIEHKTIEEN